MIDWVVVPEIGAVPNILLQYADIDAIDHRIGLIDMELRSRGLGQRKREAMKAERKALRAIWMAWDHLTRKPRTRSRATRSRKR